MSYEYFEELNKLKSMLKELGIYNKIRELEKRIEELEERLYSLNNMQDVILRKLARGDNEQKISRI